MQIFYSNFLIPFSVPKFVLEYSSLSNQSIWVTKTQLSLQLRFFPPKKFIQCEFTCAEDFFWGYLHYSKKLMHSKMCVMYQNISGDYIYVFYSGYSSSPEVHGTLRFPSAEETRATNSSILYTPCEFVFKILYC